MHHPPNTREVQGHSNYVAWLVGEARGIDRSLARIHLLLSTPAPHQECWCQELAAVIMQWRIFMLDAQLRSAIPPRCCEFHRWYMGIVEMLTGCGDALTGYIHRQDELDEEVVRRLALKRLARARHAWQELHPRLSALDMRESVAAITAPEAQPPA